MQNIMLAHHRDSYIDNKFLVISVVYCRAIMEANYGTLLSLFKQWFRQILLNNMFQLLEKHIFSSKNHRWISLFTPFKFIIVTLANQSANFTLIEGARWLPWWPWCLVSPYIKRCMAFLNCWSRLAHFWLHCWRIQGNLS